MKFFAFLLAVLTLTFTATVIGSMNETISVAQIHRFEHDLKPPIEDANQFIEKAHLFLERLVVMTDLNQVREFKREFLSELAIICKRDGSKAKTKSMKKGAETSSTPAVSRTYFLILFDYPTIQEAFELAFTELDAQEAVELARSLPEYFFQASPAVLEAIPDYSAFLPEDVKLEQEYMLAAYLLDIDSAVRTLSASSVIQALENVDFELNPRQQELIKCRVPELIELARYNARLVYQFVLPYTDSALHESKSADGASKKTKNAKKKNKSKTKDLKEILAEIVNPESPAKHPLYGNLISASDVIDCKSSNADWKMLVLAYVVYTDTLMEQAFDKFVSDYWNFYGFAEKTFIMFHQFIIDDLKMISQERAKLLALSGWSEDWKIILSVPLRKQLRDALVAANREAITILSSVEEDTPAMIQQWVWNQVNTTVFQSKSTEEIFDAFKRCMADEAFSRFRGGYVASILFEHLLFGENVSESEAFKNDLMSYFTVNANHYIPEFGGLLHKIPELEPKSIVDIIIQVVGSNDDPNMEYVENLKRRNFLQQLIQCTLPSDVLLEAVTELNEYSAQVPDVFSSIKECLLKFPEIIGNLIWSYLIENGFCPEIYVKNFTGNMLRYHGEAIKLPNLELLDRGLYAIPVETVKEFLRNCNFILSDSVRFAERLNPEVWTQYRLEASEESGKFFNMLTPLLCTVKPKTFDNIYLAEVLINAFKKKPDVNKFCESILKYLLAIEISFLWLRAGGDCGGDWQTQLMLEIEQEVVTRETLASYLEKVLKKSKSPAITAKLQEVLEYLKMGPLTYRRIPALLNMRRLYEQHLTKMPSIRASSALKYANRLLSAGNYNDDRTHEEMNSFAIELGRKFMKTCRTLMPDNEYNEALYALITLESALIPCKLNFPDQPAEILRKISAGQFGIFIQKILSYFSTELFLNFDEGEFVTQDLVEARRADIRKKLLSSGNGRN